MPAGKLFKFLHNAVTSSVLVLLVSMLSVNFLPDKLFHDFPIEPVNRETPNFESVIPEWNNKLSAKESQPEYIQLNNIVGPESIAISSDGLLYTGLADGRIVELDPSKGYKLRQVLKFKTSPQCKDNVATKPECGRFLQLRFLNNTLYALEGSNGLYKVDVKTGTKTFVGPKSLHKINLFNAFAFDPKDSNLVYITISSTRWGLFKIIWSILELDASGEVIALDIKTGKRAVVFDQLLLANGIDVDAARDQMIFAELSNNKINSAPLADIRAAFRNAKDGDKLSSVQRRALIPLVPGTPDNIVIQGDTAYIALPFVKPNGKELFDHLSTMPNVRKAYARFAYGLGKILQYVCDNIYNHPLVDSFYRDLLSGHFNYRLLQNDKSGVIVYNLATGSSKFYGSDAFGFVSEAMPDNKGHLYLGSFRSPFIVKIKSP